LLALLVQTRIPENAYKVATQTNMEYINFQKAAAAAAQ
jgi:hypothetical protein